MANKFGYSLSNKRNREIFGPSWGQIALAVAVVFILLLLLIVMLDEDEEGVIEEIEEIEEELPAQVKTEQDTTRPTPKQTETAPEESIIGECPLPSLPLVEFTEETVFG